MTRAVALLLVVQGAQSLQLMTPSRRMAPVAPMVARYAPVSMQEDGGREREKSKGRQATIARPKPKPKAKLKPGPRPQAKLPAQPVVGLDRQPVKQATG